MPCMIITEVDKNGMPLYKGDKKIVNIEFIDT
jgi:hypothetical protein